MEPAVVAAVIARDPLSIVENRLGSVQTWPTYVITYMFAEDPTMPSVRMVAAFMYGNNVPLREAIECYQACNGGRLRFIDESMHEWYYIWDRSWCKWHMEAYYSVEIRAMAWINGKTSEGVEPCSTAAPVVYFGVEPSCCARLIQGAIDNVREGRGNARNQLFRQPLAEIDMNIQKRKCN